MKELGKISEETKGAIQELQNDVPPQDGFVQ